MVRTTIRPYDDLIQAVKCLKGRSALTFQDIVHLDPEIAHGAFQLSMAKQKLAGSQIAGLL